MKFKFEFAWYDFWIGLYWNRAHKQLYIFPIPMLGISIQFKMGKYSCASCGFGLQKPCEHWLNLISDSTENEEEVKNVS